MRAAPDRPSLRVPLKGRHGRSAGIRMIVRSLYAERGDRPCAADEFRYQGYLLWLRERQLWGPLIAAIRSKRGRRAKRLDTRLAVEFFPTSGPSLGHGRKASHRPGRRRLSEKSN
jgi:hypothetical protein